MCELCTRFGWTLESIWYLFGISSSLVSRHWIHGWKDAGSRSEQAPTHACTKHHVVVCVLAAQPRALFLRSLSCGYRNVVLVVGCALVDCENKSRLYMYIYVLQITRKQNPGNCPRPKIKYLWCGRWEIWDSHWPKGTGQPLRSISYNFHATWFQEKLKNLSFPYDNLRFPGYFVKAGKNECLVTNHTQISPGPPPSQPAWKVSIKDYLVLPKNTKVTVVKHWRGIFVVLWFFG